MYLPLKLCILGTSVIFSPLDPRFLNPTSASASKASVARELWRQLTE